MGEASPRDTPHRRLRGPQAPTPEPQVVSPGTLEPWQEHQKQKDQDLGALPTQAAGSPQRPLPPCPDHPQVAALTHGACHRAGSMTWWQAGAQLCAPWRNSHPSPKKEVAAWGSQWTAGKLGSWSCRGQTEPAP